VDEGTTFTQTRDCQQNQEKVWNYDSGITSIDSRTESKTITVEESRSATGTLENWVAISSTFTTWTNTGSGYSYGSWLPAATTQTADFTQSRNYSQDQERTRTEREQNSYTGVIRNTGTFTETQTITESQNRTIDVSVNNYANTGATYSCTAWSPATNTVDEGTSFTQTRDCQQDQVRTWTYKAGSTTIHDRDQTQTITVQESRNATGTLENWVAISSTFTSWTDTGSGYSYGTWSPAASTQTSNFTQSRSYSQDQERTRTEREQNSYTNAIRNTGSFTETQTITESQNRTIDVSANSYTNTGGTYSCTGWSPATNTVDEGTNFTQTRNCQQDQEKTWTYKAGSTTIHDRAQSQTITVQESRSATGTLKVCLYNTSSSNKTYYLEGQFGNTIYLNGASYSNGFSGTTFTGSGTQSNPLTILSTGEEFYKGEKYTLTDTSSSCVDFGFCSSEIRFELCPIN